MTLDEAIFHHRKQADKNRRDAEWMKEQASKGNKLPLADKKIPRCEERAGYHEQHTEWLTDYKRLLEEHS